MRNYARDFNDKTLYSLYEEELHKNNIIKSKIARLWDDLRFYGIVSVIFVFLIVIPSWTALAIGVFFVICCKTEYFRERYITQTAILVMVVGVYYIVLLFNIPGISALVYMIPYAILFMSVVGFIGMAVKIYLNSTFWGSNFICNYLGKYNLARQKIASDDKLCRLESEINVRKKRAEEETLNN